MGGSRGGKRHLPNPAPLDLPSVGSPTLGASDDQTGPQRRGPNRRRREQLSGERSGHGHEHHAGHIYHEHGHGHDGHRDAAVAEANLVTDPVCGMKVDPATSRHHVEHAGTIFHFCSAGCRTKFVADPGKYLVRPRRRAEPAAAAGHDLHLSDAPGDPAGGPGHLPDLRHGAGAGGDRRGRPERGTGDMTRRFWVGLALTLRSSCWRWAPHPGLGLPTSCRRASTWVQLLWRRRSSLGRVAVLRPRLASLVTRNSTCSP